MKTLFPGIFEMNGFLATQNLVPGHTVYNERLIKKGDIEYRTWDAFRSKLAGAIKKGLKMCAFSQTSKVLYLGASTGTTPSHVSDICSHGEVYAVEFSPHVIKPLMNISEHRPNLIPILGDARKPKDYAEVGEVDIIYQDVAQPDQPEIMIANSNLFLKKGGYAYLCVKSQSIDVTSAPQKVFEDVEKKLVPFFDVLERIKLEPYDKDHLFLVLRKK